jgi:hypothetical protein
MLGLLLQRMATQEKRRGRSRGGSTYKLKQLTANRVDAPKSFGDLLKILQLKIFEMARVYTDSSEADVRTSVVLRAVCRRWKTLIDFADDSTYHLEYSYYVDAQLRDIGGPNEVRSDSAWSSYGWILENLTRALMEW